MEWFGKTINEINDLFLKAGIKNMEEISQKFLSNDYKISNIYTTKHDENTRFVIVEKYPERDDKWEESESGAYKIHHMYVNVEVIQNTPVQNITVDFTVDSTDNQNISSDVQ